MLPEFVWRIGEASGSEGVRGREITEFVVNRGSRNMYPGQQGGSKSQGKEEDEGAGKQRLVRQPQITVQRMRCQPWRSRLNRSNDRFCRGHFRLTDSVAECSTKVKMKFAKPTMIASSPRIAR